MTEENGDKAGGKGHATPSRKQAEAERRARMKQPLTRKERAKREAERRRELRTEQRAAMRSGRGSALPYRDQGPVRAFARDYVDRRWNVAEFLVPILILTLSLSLFGTPQTAVATVVIYFVTFVAVVIDLWILRRGLRKQLIARFGAENIGGDSPYAIMRAAQVRFLRLPKPAIKRGAPLPD